MLLNRLDRTIASLPQRLVLLAPPEFVVPDRFTSCEFDLLMAFIRQRGQAASRSALLAALRGRAWTYFDRSIDTLVARLRKKIGADPGRPPLIRSVRGVGYVFCAAVSYQCYAARAAA